MKLGFHVAQAGLEIMAKMKKKILNFWSSSLYLPSVWVIGIHHTLSINKFHTGTTHMNAHMTAVLQILFPWWIPYMKVTTHTIRAGAEFCLYVKRSLFSSCTWTLKQPRDAGLIGFLNSNASCKTIFDIFSTVHKKQL